MKFHSINFILLTLCSVLYSKATWLTYTSFRGYLPTHTYPLTLNAGDRINATVKWANTSTDIDVYLYQSGVDLLLRSNYLIRCYSGAHNP